MDKTMPKSLHTVTVLVRLASALSERNGLEPVANLQTARSILGQAFADDSHGLMAKARAILSKGVA